MRKYEKGTNKLIKVVCNCCGKALQVTDGVPKEGFCPVEVDWGYHSRRDLEHHSFDLCEDCYDRLIENFVLAPEVEERTEV